MYKCINTDEYGYEMCTMSTHNPKKRVQNAVRPQWSQHWAKKIGPLTSFPPLAKEYVPATLTVFVLACRESHLIQIF